MQLNNIFGEFRQSLSGLYSNNEIRQFFYILVENFLNLSSVDIHTNPNLILSELTYNKIIDAQKRLSEQEPIQYIVGKVDFYDLKLNIAPGVLIPRPETEELVDWIIRDNQKPAKSVRILDIGSGSGCIAISLALNIKSSKISALDKDVQAINMIKRNAELYNTKINIVNADIFETDKIVKNFENKFDIIVSNPPYVLESDKKLMQNNVLDYEPHQALFVPDNDPLKYYSAIIDFCKLTLLEGSYLYLEIHENYHQEIYELLDKNLFKEIIIKKDINGKYRMVKAKYE